MLTLADVHPMEVCRLVFVSWCLLILQPHSAALYDGWSPGPCVRAGPVRAGSQWSSSRQLKFPLAAAKTSSFFHFSFLSSQTAVPSFLFLSLKGSACFSLSSDFFVTSYLPVSISTFNTQHTLSSRVTAYRQKVRHGHKSCGPGKIFCLI